MTPIIPYEVILTLLDNEERLHDFPKSLSATHRYVMTYSSSIKMNACHVVLSLKRFILHVAVLLSVFNVLAAQEQESPTDCLGFSTSLGLVSIREDLLVPMSFDGPLFSLGAEYRHQDADHLIVARLKLRAAYLRNRFSHEGMLLGSDLRISCLKKISGDTDSGELWGGICLPLQMNNAYFFSWDDAHMYWFTAHGLGIALEWQQEIPGLFRASFHMESPLFAWVARPLPYRLKKQDAMNKFGFHFSEPNRRLHFATLDSYRSVFMQALVSWRLSSSVCRLGIEMEYSSYTQPKMIQNLGTTAIFIYQWEL